MNLDTAAKKDQQKLIALLKQAIGEVHACHLHQAQGRPLDPSGWQFLQALSLDLGRLVNQLAPQPRAVPTSAPDLSRPPDASHAVHVLVPTSYPARTSDVLRPVIMPATAPAGAPAVARAVPTSEPAACVVPASAAACASAVSRSVPAPEPPHATESVRATEPARPTEHACAPEIACTVPAFATALAYPLEAPVLPASASMTSSASIDLPARVGVSAPSLAADADAALRAYEDGRSEALAWCGRMLDIDDGGTGCEDVTSDACVRIIERIRALRQAPSLPCEVVDEQGLVIAGPFPDPQDAVLLAENLSAIEATSSDLWNVGAQLRQVEASLRRPGAGLVPTMRTDGSSQSAEAAVQP